MVLNQSSTKRGRVKATTDQNAHTSPHSFKVYSVRNHASQNCRHSLTSPWMSWTHGSPDRLPSSQVLPFIGLEREGVRARKSGTRSKHSKHRHAAATRTWLDGEKAWPEARPPVADVHASNIRHQHMREEATWAGRFGRQPMHPLRQLHAAAVGVHGCIDPCTGDRTRRRGHPSGAA